MYKGIEDLYEKTRNFLFLPERTSLRPRNGRRVHQSDFHQRKFGNIKVSKPCFTGHRPVAFFYLRKRTPNTIQSGLFRRRRS